MNNDAEVIDRQLRFFIEKKAGCLFAAAAAQSPGKYGWVHRITTPRADAIDVAVVDAIADEATTTLSLLFPDITTLDGLVELIATLRTCSTLLLEQSEIHHEFTCLGFRARVGTAKSYVTGFGDFAFLPATRRAPIVELTTRVKPRPKYDFVFKKTEPGIIHLADLDMRGASFKTMKWLWDNSFAQTKRVLGALPDIRSAARTTYCVPTNLVR